MKQIEKIVDVLCTATAAIYFLLTVALVIAQAVALIMLNGELSAGLFKLLVYPAGFAAAATALLSVVLAYLRKEMSQ